MPYYVQVRGVWHGSPAIYVGPFGDYYRAVAAVARVGGRLGASGDDPRQDVVIAVLSEAEADRAGRDERHTLPPAQPDRPEEGFDTPTNWAEFSRLFYRRFGYH